MKKRFKKIYIEITNKCNLNCKFCAKDHRKKEFMNKENFEKVIENIKQYTEYVYLHVKGEPLLHPNINELIELAYENKLNVNITTNGYLMDNLKSKKIRQINYSIQSGRNIEEIKEIIWKLKKYVQDTNIYLSLRLWTKDSKENVKMKKFLKEEFKIEEELKDKSTIAKNIFLSIEEEFIWPDLENEIMQNKGFCYGLQDHIGILVDGTVIPCCLDHKADIKLGNIFEQNIEEILNNKKVSEMINGFKDGKLKQELCRKCGFLNSKSKNIAK